MFLQKRKITVKITALILCVILFSSACFSSCGSKYTDFMTLKHGNKTYKLSVNVMNYFLSVYKTIHLIQGGADSTHPEYPEFPTYWAQSYADPSYPSAKTVGDIIKEQTVASIKRMLAAEALFDYHKLSLTKEQTNNIDKAIRELVSTHSNSSAALNDTLAAYSINMDILKDIRVFEKKYSVLRDYLFLSKTGTEQFTDEQIKEMFDRTYEDYVRIKHILVLTKSDKTDDEGNTVEFTEEELAEKKAYAEDIAEQIKNGKNIDEFYSVTEDPGNNASTRPNGYFFTHGDMVSEYETAAYEMKVGEVRIVQTSYGYHVMQKFDKDELFETKTADSLLSPSSTTSTYKSESLAAVQEERFTELLAPFLSEIKMNNQEVKKLQFNTIPTLFNDTDLLPSE